MNKNEKDYLSSKLRGISEASKKAYAEAHPHVWTAKEILLKLQALGFTTPSTESQYIRTSYEGGYADINLPRTEEMKANKVLIDAFYKKVDESYRDAVDSIYLGSADALGILAQFRATMEQLAQ